MSSYQDKTVPYQTTWTLLENLVKFTTYDIRVSAFNSIGDGPHSAPHSIYVGDAGKYYHECDYVRYLYVCDQ